VSSLPEAEIVARIRRLLFDDDERQLIAVYLYGSAARDELREDSDIDLAFLGRSSPPVMDVIHAAGDLMGLVRREVDLVDLRTAPTVLRAQVVTKGRRLHIGDPTEADCFEMYALSDYATLEEERRPVIEAMLARYRRG
jgi:predicted nucleotidyltransferase